MRHWILKTLIVVLSVLPFSAMGVGILDTLHNLSASGPGKAKAVTGERVCIFCHVSHTSNSSIAPMWNREQPALNYTPYTSSTAVATPGQPTGDSLLCLSCHDGTIALGKTFATGVVIGNVGRMPPGLGLLSQDLSDDHPISFVYDSGLASSVPDGELRDPAVLTSTQMKLDANGELQCSTCHNAHDNTFGKFLVMSNQASAMCVTCHNKRFWDNTYHNVSMAIWDGVGPNPWPFTRYNNVTDNGCQNCHQPHSTGQGPRLLNYAAEEDTCTACHNGHVAAKDIAEDFANISSHPVDMTAGIHEPNEPHLIGSPRHVECVDCHDPHAVQSGGFPSSALVNIPGIDANGLPVDVLSHEYELCYRCHADSPSIPVPRTLREVPESNLRKKFDSNNPSFHPVQEAGRNSNVPSLITPLTTSSTITCGDCHGSDNPAVKGPHGSSFTPILKRRYETASRQVYSTAAYGLCYGCHSEAILLGEVSGFPHERHTKRTSCNTCHDPHGVSVGGNTTNNSHLINFDTNIVTGLQGASPVFTDLGTFTGECSLACHNTTHNGSSY